jgi:hypothetical protein
VLAVNDLRFSKAKRVGDRESQLINTSFLDRRMRILWFMQIAKGQDLKKNLLIQQEEHRVVPFYT